MSDEPTVFEPHSPAPSPDPAITAPAPNAGAVLTEDLDPPYAAHVVQPVVNADLGLGIRHIENHLFVTFERWFNLNVGDVYEFYMRDTRFPLAWGEIRPGDENNERFQLAIARELVPVGFVFPCYGRVLRIGSSNESTSVQQTWFIKNTRPGGVDQDPGLPYHSELKVRLPADLQGGAVLDPDRAAQGVILTVEPYPEMRVRDSIEMYWNGHLVMVRLDEDHVSAAKPIEVPIDPEIIFRPHGSGLLTIRFRVQDEVLNFSGELQQWSQVLHLESDLDPDLLRRPYFLLDGNDITDVNFDTQGQGKFEIEVYVPDRLPSGALTPAGTQIVATLTGTRADGSPLVMVMPPFPARIGRSATAPVANNVLKELINGSVQISYELQFPLGTVLGSSRRLTVTVFGTISTMPPVNVVEDDAGLIDPNLETITIEFPEYSPYDRDYSVTLRMEALLPGGGVEFWEQVRLAGAPPPPTRYRIVPRSQFQRFVGLGDVKIFYRVDDGRIDAMGGGVMAVRESEHLTVRFGERLGTLPKPLLESVDEHDNLDPDDVMGQVAVTLPYVRTAPGDTIEWRWRGSGAHGSIEDTITLNGSTAGRPVIFDVDKLYVERNLNGEIRLSYSVIPGNGGAPLFSEVLVVSVGRALGSLLRPEVLEASRNPDHLTPEAAAAGATIRVSFAQMLPSDRIRACWTGIPGVGSHCQTKDGNSSKTIDFEVDATVVGANIHPAGRDISVQYFLIRGARETPSEILTLRLLTLTTLPTPTIEGIGETPVLDLSRLAGHERTTISRWPFIHRQQRMWMEYEGTYTDGSPYFEATYSNQPVTTDGETNGILPPTPVDELRQLRDGSLLTIRFWVSFDRGSDKSSALQFRVRQYLVQALPSVLPHPFINGASGNGPNVTVEPLAIENNVRVTVQYTGMLTTDRILLEWIYQDCSIHTATLNGLAGGTVVFNLNNNILARSVNSTVVLRYALMRSGVPVPSEDQTVRVNTLPSANLPRPLINGITSAGTLDLRNFIGNGLAALAKWPLSAQGQRVWLRCSSAGVADLVVLDGVAITASEAVNGLVNKAVLRSWLDGLTNHAQITVTCGVTFDGSVDELKAVSFPSTTYVIAKRTGMIGTIAIASPSYLALDASASRLFVCCTTADTVSVIDTSTNRIIKTITGFTYPHLIAMDNNHGRMYVNNYRLGTISVIDTLTCEIIANFNPGFGASSYTLDPTGSRLYIADYTHNRIHVYDTSSLVLANLIFVHRPWGVAFNNQNTLVYVAGEDRISVVDVASQLLTRVVPISTVIINLEYSPFRDRLYSFDPIIRQMYTIDPNSLTIQRTIPFADNTMSSSGRFFNHDRREVYIGIRPKGSYVVVNPDTEQIVRRVEGLGQGGIAGMAFVPGSNIAYISNTHNHRVDGISI